MAAHVRTQIREAVAGLVTGLATTGGRVYQSRVYPLEAADLPGLLVFSESETTSPFTIHNPRAIQRLLTLRVAGLAKAVDGLDDVLDQICLEVEVALANPLVLEPLAETITLTRTEIEMVGTADQPIGSATMTFEVDYTTAENAPDVAL